MPKEHIAPSKKQCIKTTVTGQRCKNYVTYVDNADDQQICKQHLTNFNVKSTKRSQRANYHREKIHVMITRINEMRQVNHYNNDLEEITTINNVDVPEANDKTIPDPDITIIPDLYVSGSSDQLDVPVSDTVISVYGTCCFCCEPCNENSQACGRCLHSFF